MAKTNEHSTQYPLGRADIAPNNPWNDGYEKFPEKDKLVGAVINTLWKAHHRTTSPNTLVRLSADDSRWLLVKSNGSYLGFCIWEGPVYDARAKEIRHIGEPLIMFDWNKSKQLADALTYDELKDTLARLLNGLSIPACQHGRTRELEEAHQKRLNESLEAQRKRQGGTIGGRSRS